MRNEPSEWIPVYTSTQEVELLALEEALNEAGIESARLDQRDSMYPMLGRVQLLVHKENEQRAACIVAQFERDEHRD